MAYGSITVKEAIDRYIEEGMIGLSRATKVTRHQMLMACWNQMRTNGAHEDLLMKGLSPEHLMKLHLTLTERGLSPASKNQYRQAMIGLVKWAWALNFCAPKEKLFLLWRRDRAPKTDQLHFTKEQLLKALESADHPRDRILIALCMYTVGRGNSIKVSRIEHVQPDRLILWDTKKGDHTFYVPMTRELQSELDRWLEFYRSQCGTLRGDWYLVPKKESFRNLGGSAGYGHGPLHPMEPITNVAKIVKRAFEKAGLPTFQQGGHTFRRSMLRILWEQFIAAGYGDLEAARICMQFSNHVRLEQFLDYVGVDFDRRKRDGVFRDKSIWSPFEQDAPTLPPGVADLASRRERMA